MWAGIADKHGTLARDVFLPKVQHMFHRFFYAEPESRARVRRWCGMRSTYLFCCSEMLAECH